jgi:hypothetical protein
VNAVLQDYIKAARTKGHNDEKIKLDLVSAGWDEQSVADGLKGEEPPTATLLGTDSSIKIVALSTAAGLEYAIMFLSLGVAAASFIGILFSAIDKTYGPVTVSSGHVPAVAAALIVSFPIFAGIFLWLNKREQRQPELRKDQNRKRIVQLSLIVTFLIGLGLVTLYAYRLLNAVELKSSPLVEGLHLITSLGVSGLIFGYFWFDEHRKEATRGKMAPYYIGVTVLAAIGAVASLIYVGSGTGPDHDRRTGADLRIISLAINNYVSRFHHLPPNPAAAGVVSGPTADSSKSYAPQPNTLNYAVGDYDYKIIDSNNYQLCANFQTDTKSNYPAAAGQSVNAHKKGNVCLDYKAAYVLNVPVSPPSATPEPTYLVLKEAGIKIPLSNAIDDLVYIYVAPTSTTPARLQFSTATIKDFGGATCGPSAEPLGTYLIYGGDVQRPAGDRGRPVTNAGGSEIYYYQATHPCGTSKDQQNQVALLSSPLYTAMYDAKPAK